jgi:hypothetical protein
MLCLTYWSIATATSSLMACRALLPSKNCDDGFSKAMDLSVLLIPVHGVTDERGKYTITVRFSPAISAEYGYYIQ